MIDKEKIFKVLEKSAPVVSILGIFVSIVITQMNWRASISLEQKKLESSLFLQAVQLNNKETTIKNLKFLIGMGILSEEWGKLVTNLTDTLQVVNNRAAYTDKNETLGFGIFHITSSSSSVTKSEELVKGANIEIVALDSTINLRISQYSDSFGTAEVTFPVSAAQKFAKVTIVKDGYVTNSFEMQLMNGGFNRTINLQRL